jgi:HEAT repeat protein
MPRLCLRCDAGSCVVALQWGCVAMWGLLLVSLALFAAPQPKPKPGDERLTRDNFDRIKVGMSKAEVVEILGPNRSSASQGNSSSLGWYFSGDGQHKAEVHFKDGRVVSKSSKIDWEKHAASGSGPQAKPAAASAAVITKANFEKLRLKMNSAEVKALWGEPSQAETASGGRTGMLWTEGHKFALAMFRDDEATEFDCSEVPPADKSFNARLYARLYAGMSADDAESLLGPPKQDDADGKGRRKTWYQDKLYIAAVFIQGRLTTKTASGGIKNAALLSFPVTDDDQLVEAIGVLKSGDAKRAARTLQFLAKAPRNDDYAEELSLLVQKWLTGKDEFARMAARRALPVWCTRANSAHFIKLIEQHNRTDSRKSTSDDLDLDYTLDILTRLKDPDAVAPIAKLLLRFFDRDEAAKALIAFGPELAQAEVVKYANHQDANVSLAARKILDEFKATPAVLLERNLADLRSTVADKRLWASQAIEHMEVIPQRRREVAKALEPLLADKYGWPAHAAAAALGKWGVPENEEALVTALTHKSPDMRRLAANALGKVGSKKSLPALQALVAKGDPLHPETIKAAEGAIASIRARKP